MLFNKRNIIFALVIFLAGCGVQESSHKSLEEKYPWDGGYDAMTSRGIMVRVTTEKSPYYLTPELPEILEFVDVFWQETQECTSIFIDPDRPFIIDYVLNVPSGTNGFIYWNKDYVYAQVALRSFKSTTRHEMIHYLLFLDGHDEDSHLQFEHESPLYDLCAH